MPAEDSSLGIHFMRSLRRPRRRLMRATWGGKAFVSHGRSDAPGALDRHKDTQRFAPGALGEHQDKQASGAARIAKLDGAYLRLFFLTAAMSSCL